MTVYTDDPKGPTNTLSKRTKKIKVAYIRSIYKSKMLYSRNKLSIEKTWFRGWEHGSVGKELAMKA